MQLQRIFLSSLVTCFVFVAACGGDSVGDDRGNGGAGGTGGTGGIGGSIGTGGTGGTAGAAGAAGTGGVGGAGGAAGCTIIECAGRVTACGDCIDNDGDGLIDEDDPECLGPCDNYEGEELLTGVGGEPGQQCQADCYFDFGNGPGNDDCKWDRQCDPLMPKANCGYNESLLGSSSCPDTQSQLCEDVCVPLTPNGCDCFGCCTFPELAGMGPDGSDGYVYIGSLEGCTFETITDPDHCRQCTPTPSCLNTCERCEICLGKPTIPEDCFTGTGGSGGSGGTGGDGGSLRCPPDKQECGLEGDDPCPAGWFCLTGCCTIAVQ